MTRILKKVTKKAESYLNEIWVSNTSYCYTKDFFTDTPAFKSRVSGGSSRYLSSSVFDKFPECFFDEKPADGEEYAEIIGRQNNSRVIKRFKTKYFNPPKNFGRFQVQAVRDYAKATNKPITAISANQMIRTIFNLPHAVRLPARLSIS